MKIGEIKANKPKFQPRVIPEVEKTPKIDIIVERTSTHKHNARSSTKRVNHVIAFKNAHNMFQIDAA